MITTTMAKTTMLAMTVAGAVACAPEAGTCSSNSDCAFGTTCSDDGVCLQVYGDSGAGGVRGGRDGMEGFAPEGLGDIVSTVATDGTFDGTIGGVVVESAVVDVNVYDFGVLARFTAAGRNSTFVIVQLTEQGGLTTPGTTTVASTYGDGYAQACNYDNASYDETFQDFIVDVSPPRAPQQDDPIIAEDAPPPPAVVDVTVTTVGDGSNVTTTFVLPATI